MQLTGGGPARLQELLPVGHRRRNPSDASPTTSRLLKLS